MEKDCTEAWGTLEITFAEAEWEPFTDRLTGVVCVRFDRIFFIRCNVGQENIGLPNNAVV